MFMRYITDITRADEEELLEIAKQRIKNFPILEKIYDDEFLNVLVRHKHDLDNLLLHQLVIDEPSAMRLFLDIEENLKILKPEESIYKFNPKLKQWNTIPFESAIAELEFAAEYKRRGYKIDIEPLLPNRRKGDFYASKDSLKIYFEVKCIFWERSLEENAIIDELLNRLSGMDEPFMIGVDIKKSFPLNNTVNVARYIRKKLRQFDQIPTSLPFSFVYPEKGEAIAEIDVHLRLPDGDTGFISGFTYGGGLKGDWSDLRSKIASGVSQLHPDYPGVLIVQPHGLETLRYDIENALFGDLKVNVIGELRPFRGKDRIFAQKKNTRLSAVIYYERRLQESGHTKKKYVYHNLHAKRKLSPEIFKGENVTQIIPIKLDNGTVYYKQSNNEE